MGEDSACRMKVTSRDDRKAMRKPWQAKGQGVKADPKKASRYYPAEDEKKKLNNHHNNSKMTKLRASITPGTVLILLAGRFKGSRVVFLKQLASGLLLITGPYAVNGVPLRRVPQSYVIATKTTVDISACKIPAEVNDELFKKPKQPKKKDDELFFEKDKESTIDEARKTLQQTADASIIKAIEKDALLKSYMSAKFSLRKGQKPHEMSF